MMVFHVFTQCWKTHFFLSFREKFFLHFQWDRIIFSFFLYQIQLLRAWRQPCSSETSEQPHFTTFCRNYKKNNNLILSRPIYIRNYLYCELVCLENLLFTTDLLWLGMKNNLKRDVYRKCKEGAYMSCHQPTKHWSFSHLLSFDQQRNFWIISLISWKYEFFSKDGVSGVEILNVCVLSFCVVFEVWSVAFHDCFF
jgi:hypothetical protein